MVDVISHSRSPSPPSLPDACIAYKLHLEYPRLINLYDWCQAFAAIVDEDLDLVV
jgi:origin recognition complex subunit 3